MKQLVYDLRSGDPRVVQVPAPLARDGGVLVRTRYSAVSVGTERAALETGRKSLLAKARERPHEVRKVLDAVAREGVRSTAHKVRSRLGALAPLGYSCAGTVEKVGAGVQRLHEGDAVACAGAGYANHAERVWAPANLVTRVPPEVPLEHAAFATIGAIALQGVRQAEVALGNVVVVIGLGLIGQITVQLLRAAGARVVAVDVDASRVALAGRWAERALLRSGDVAGAVYSLSAGIGADAVIIAASTRSEDPVRLAGELARDRARVVVVGAVPINVPRRSYYAKELELRLSRSYGPGRYDPAYEEKGQDYPAGYVRWTEGRNLGEFVRLLATGVVTVEPLISSRVAIADAAPAYAALGDSGERPLGILLEYPVAGGGEGGGGGTAGSVAPSALPVQPWTRRASGRVGIGFAGAGSFATGVLLPLLRRLPVELRGVTTASGITARNAAETYGFAYAASSPEEVISDPQVDAVFIATRHAEHASLAAAALRAGKAVFVEKPLAITDASLAEVLAAAAGARPLMVGFNRRFAPATEFVLRGIAGRAGTRMVHARVNAGALPRDHWVHDREVGGGRLIGEGCHFIDLVAVLAGDLPVEARAVAIAGADADALLEDNLQVTLRFAGGSVGSVLYTAKGSRSMAKERIEVFAGGCSAVIDDFRSAELHDESRSLVRALIGRGGTRWTGKQDKGHAAALRAFIDAVRADRESPIPLAQVAASSWATLAAARSLRSGRAEPVPRFAGPPPFITAEIAEIAE
ncbi:MAG: bi-domain-containing oxidoreductase [Longimicrobiales bacterium]